MKNIEIKTRTNAADVEEILLSYGWRKFIPGTKKEYDFYGVSSKGEKTIIHLNETSKKDIRTIPELVQFSSERYLPKVTFTWENFRKSYVEAKTMEEKVSLIAQYLGLERPPTKELLTVDIQRETLTQFEREFLSQVLDSFGVAFGFTLVDGKLVVSFEKSLPKDYKQMVPSLVDIWLKPNQKVELNFDVDIDSPRILKKLIKRLIDKFGIDNIQIRRSASRKWHLRVIDKLYPPKKALEIRSKLGDSIVRVNYDRMKLRARLRPDFLYDVKYGRPAGKWRSLKNFMEERGWK